LHQQRLEKKIESLQLSEGTLYISPGTLSQEYQRKLLSKVPPGSTLLLEEHNRSGSQDGQIQFANFQDSSAYPSILEKLSLRPLRKIQALFLLSISTGMKESVQEMVDLFWQAIGHFWKNNATERFFFLTWQRNRLQNISRNKGKIKLLRPQNNNRCPILLVGAGVSNQEVLPKLSPYNRSYILLAVDTALGALLEHDLLPDAVIALEGQHHNNQDFLPLGSKNIPFIADLSSHPLPPAKWSSETFWTLTAAAPTNQNRRLASSAPIPLIPPPGNVGNFAYTVARMISQGPLYLTGMDYCFPLGQSHSKGSTYSHSHINHSGRLMGPYQNHWEEIKQGRAIKEGSTLSNPAMRTYRKELLHRLEKDKSTYILQGMAHWPREKNMSFKDFSETLARQKLDHNWASAPWDAKDFFLREKNLLEALINTPLGQWTQEEMMTMDYLFHHFPDKKPLPNQQRSFLNRLSESATVVHNLYKKFLNQ
jgi:hypothetical protein